MFPRFCRAAAAPLLSLLLSLFVSAPRAAPAALPPAVAAALDRAKLPRDAVVVMVQEVGTGTPRLAWQVDRPVNPASLMKLLTTFASLDLLGPAWRWSTPVWLQGTLRDGVLDGNLVIKGSGDPKLVVERVWLLLRRVQQLGVREIRGDIVLDRSGFAEPEASAFDFDGEGLRPYNVRADALMLNYKALAFTFTPDAARGVAMISVDPPLAGVGVGTSVPLAGGGCNDWRGALRADFADPARLHFAGNYPAACGEKTWPVAYADPKRYNERAIAGMWLDMGGRLSGSVHDGAAPATTPPTFTLSSPTLADVIRDINKYSNNVMAQQLFLTLALTQRGSGTPEAARDLLRQWAGDRLGPTATAGLVIDNGSGLSREGRVSARLLAQLLLAAWASPVMPELMSSLPVSGVDGTLGPRRAAPSGPSPSGGDTEGVSGSSFPSRATLGRAHLKTGSLRDVAGVAGYVLAYSGRRYVMVAIANHANANAAGPVFDALVQWTANDSGPVVIEPTQN
jgi:D-alanyl-D-alanine carboxypeptidase/D-alanyl-D-alanine-endopeptidase (penicillin-binding protein 4)